MLGDRRQRLGGRCQDFTRVSRSGIRQVPSLHVAHRRNARAGHLSHYHGKATLVLRQRPPIPAAGDTTTAIATGIQGSVCASLERKWAGPHLIAGRPPVMEKGGDPSKCERTANNSTKKNKEKKIPERQPIPTSSQIKHTVPSPTIYVGVV